MIPNKTSCFLLAALPFAGALAAAGQSDETLPQTRPAISLKLEIESAIQRGAQWLLENQSDDGSWSNSEHPALTAFALVALRGNPEPPATDEYNRRLEKGYAFLLDSAHRDGGIYRTESLRNYNTSVSIMALLAAEKSEYEPIIKNARQYLIGEQKDFGETGEIDSSLDGGLGYGGDSESADMSNTVLALEALYYSKHLVADQPDDDTKDLNWEAAIHFIQSCQNLPETNKEKWVTGDPQNRGGFVYYPGSSKAGEMKLDDGRTALRSYGSISYAGLLSYAYADLKPDDPRVTAVLDWLQKNFTLEENPGMGLQGLFYYFHTMAKALSIYGIDTLTLKDGTSIHWKKDLALKLFNLQKPDGSWANENGRWWEKDPALCTAYTLIALERIYHGM